MEKELYAIVHGRVQMVMYRDFVQRAARRLGLRGTVQNLSDGTVEVIAQGEEAKLQQLVKRLKRGPLLARVDRVDVSWREPAQKVRNFAILL